MDTCLYSFAPESADSDTKYFLKVVGQATSSDQQPLHLTLVIDTSGSMELEDRLTNVKRSLHFLVSFLGPQDLVSLISFDDAATTHCKAQLMTLDGQSYVQQLIKGVSIGTSTNMSAGIIQAQECLSATPPTHKPALLLLTDGEVNRGIRDVAGLTAMVRNLRATHPTLTVYTVGYGLQHNGNLLTELATEGNGAYTIVNSQEQVASVFGDMLGGLMTCVAQNVEVHLPADAVVKTGFRILVDTSGKKRVQIGDIYAQASQVLLSEVSAPLKITYLTADGTLHTVEPIPTATADESVRQEMAGTELRIRAADILKGADNADAMRSLIADIEVMQPSWAAPVIAELRLRLAPPTFWHGLGPGLMPTVSGAQQAACLSMARGLINATASAASATDDDPLNTAFIAESTFSSPVQRRTTERLRQVSSQATP
jgi:hypothetical protein